MASKLKHSDSEDKKAQREVFYKKFDNLIRSISAKRQAKCVIRQELYDKAVASLKSPKGKKFEDTRLKSWAKYKFFLMTTRGKELLYCSKTKLPVVAYENLFDTLYDAHARVGHHGRDKTRNEILASYSYVPYKSVDLLVKTCRHCATKTAEKHSPTPESIAMGTGFLTRVQVELIDFCSKPDGKYRWILHLKDTFSKFTWLFPLSHNDIPRVAKKLKLVFSMFGCPRILQSGMGKEFTSSVIGALKTDFTDVNLINGRPKQPQMKHVVETWNTDVTRNLNKKMIEQQITQQWSKLLPFVMNVINNTPPPGAKNTPFEIVFGQTRKTDSHFYDTLANLGIKNEEDIPEELLNRQNSIIANQKNDNQTLEMYDPSVMWKNFYTS